MSFDVKALRAKVVVFYNVISYSLVFVNISQELAATIVMVVENEKF